MVYAFCVPTSSIALILKHDVLPCSFLSNYGGAVFMNIYQWGTGQMIGNLWRARTNLVPGLRFPTPTCYHAYIDSGSLC